MGCYEIAMAFSSTTYQSKWYSGETKPIRIPKAIADNVIEYAYYLDRELARNSVQEASSLYSTKSNLRRLNTEKPINVASVPLRSPFRYPGGKTWLVPYIRIWLDSLDSLPDLFIEPFAGGGICSLTVAFENLANHIIMAEMDDNVAAVWQTVLAGQGEWLASKIMQFDLTLENVKKALLTSYNENIPLKQRAFLTILRNRVQRGGIMAPGAGLVKAGENGKGIRSRWYPQTLARRIRDIDKKRGLITFHYGDGMNLMNLYAKDERCVIFADPPYTKAAKRLYQCWEFNHRELFKVLSTCKCNFLVSYDNTQEIWELAKEFDFDASPVKMKNTHNSEMTELLIGRDLSWLKNQLSFWLFDT